MPQPLIEVKNLVKTFKVGKTVVRSLRGIDFQVMPGEFLIIEGPSGSGKTTLLNMLAGLDPCDNGEILINGKSLQNFSELEMEKYRRHEIGMVFQNFNLISSLKAMENVGLPLRFAGVKTKIRRPRTIKLLDMVGLKDRAKHFANALSGGEQQRVAIARALANNPQILLVDEPTGNLDSKIGTEIMNLLKELNTNYGRTILLVTHNPVYTAFATRILTLKDGKIVSEQNMPPLNVSVARSEENDALFSSVALPFKHKMRFLDILVLSFHHFWFAKIRTFLTILGMAIGISAIVLFVSLGFGLQKITTSSLASLEDMQTLLVNSPVGSNLIISNDTINQIEKIKGVKLVSPFISANALGVLSGVSTAITVKGISLENLDFEQVKVATGQKFSSDTANEVIISETALKGFDLKDPEKLIGQTLKLQIVPEDSGTEGSPPPAEFKEVDLKVVGISGEKVSPEVYVPLSVAQKNVSTSYSGLTVKIADFNQAESIKGEIEKMDLDVAAISGLINQINKAFLIIELILGLIGGIALVVASFGIVNTMIISLLERTREIGVMKAIGIAKKDVKRLFVYEACFFGIFGGLLGIAIGWGVGLGINCLIALVAHKSGQDIGLTLFVTPYKFAILVFFFAVLIARIAGIYPSWSAMRKSPLEALRYE